MSSLFTKAIPYVICTAFLITLFCLQIHFFYPGLFFLDDPYIVLHSAQVLHIGHDINYLGTPALAGNSSPIHLFFVYLLLFITPPLYALIMSNWLGILCYTWGILCLCRLSQCSIWQSMALAVCGLFSGTMIEQLCNGLETSLIAAASIWILIILQCPMTKSYRYLLAFLLGSLPFIRPELIALSFVIYFFQLYRYQQNHLLCIKNICQDICFMIGAALPWMIWLWHTTGSVVPNTISAKSAFFIVHYTNKFARLNTTISILINFFKAISSIYWISIFFLATKRLGQAILLFLIIFLIVYTCTAPQTIGHNNFRYLYNIFIPFLLFGLISGLQSKKLLIHYSAQIAVMLITLSTLFTTPLYYRNAQMTTHAIARLQSAYTMWCQKHLPHDQIIAVQDAGFIAYATPLKLIDFIGLKSPENVALHEAYTKRSQGALRNEAISLILKKNHAHYLIMTEDWVDHDKLPSALRALGWQVMLIKKISVQWGNASAAYMIYQISDPVIPRL